MSFNVEVLEQPINFIPSEKTTLAPDLYHQAKTQLFVAEESKYSNIFENAIVGIFQATIDGIYADANPMLARIYGYDSPQDLIKNACIPALYVQPNRYLELAIALRDRPAIFQWESEVYRQDGSKIWVSENIWRTCDPEGNLIGWQGIVEDITERKQAELDLKLALQAVQQQWESKTKSLSMFSHEFRSSMTLILITSDLLKLHGEKMTYQKRREYLGKIGDTVKTMAEMLEEAIAADNEELEQQQLMKGEKIDLRQLCQEIWQDVQAIAQASQTLELNASCDRIGVIANKTLLRQILSNLLLNAVKYSPAESKIYLDLHCQIDRVVCQVKDEGIGIPLEEQAYIFNAFHRASNAFNLSGTGLGLAIVKRAVNLLGGTVNLESALGMGSTFTLTLPVSCTQLNQL